tara:strand:- start:3218 stop:3442 length:225 start_codon:yes stop_codon:yes gene_type:complete
MYINEFDFEFVEDDGALLGDVVGGIDFDSKTIVINASIEALCWVSFSAHKSAFLVAIVCGLKVSRKLVAIRMFN